MRLLTAKEVAGMLHVTTARVYELARSGVLPTVHLGERQRRFSEDALLRWIASGGSSTAQVSADLGRSHVEEIKAKEGR